MLTLRIRLFFLFSSILLLGLSGCRETIHIKAYPERVSPWLDPSKYPCVAPIGDYSGFAFSIDGHAELAGEIEAELNPFDSLNRPIPFMMLGPVGGDDLANTRTVRISNDTTRRYFLFVADAKAIRSIRIFIPGEAHPLFLFHVGDAMERPVSLIFPPKEFSYQ